MDLGRIGKEARVRDPGVSSIWVIVRVISVDELPKYEMEQAGLLFGRITDLLMELIKAMSSLPRKVPTHTH